MKLANRAFIIALTMLALIISTSAQKTLRSTDDTRNTAPTVGTGGPPGGPTGLFTVYDGQTLRKGEFTFSAAYSNYDRDPGNADIVETPLSFQVGLSDHLELWFNTDGYRAIKINSPRNLSGFYLPNSSLRINGVQTTGGAIVLAPRGPGTSQFPNSAVFRPVGLSPFTQFPFVGGNAGTFGFGSVPGVTAGGVFGFPTAVATLGPPVGTSGNGADNFPGIGSVYGGILPGIVLQTGNVGAGGANTVSAPTSFTLAPSYLPDAPFINRTYGESAFSTFTVGAKYRFTGPNNPYGVGLIPFYRFYADQASDFSGFNQLQRGASPGGGGPNPFSRNKGRGDFGLVAFADARLTKHVNLSGNLGYIYNSSVKADFPTGTFTILDRPDEIIAAIGVDFPINRYFQPIAEFRSLHYAGGRTPNSFENSPLDAIVGARFYPTRYISLGAAYRSHINQQDANSFGDNTFTNRAAVANSTVGSSNSFTGAPSGFQFSQDPHGYILQLTAGRRNERKAGELNKPANVTSLDLSETTVTNGCPSGQVPAEGTTCSADMVIDVRTTAVDPENDVLTYVYTVSGGRINGTGANVSWDLTGVSPGTYTITSGVDDSCGVCGQTQTKTVTVANCNCVTPVAPVAVCACPTISVSGPTDVTQPGGTMTFTANVGGGSNDNNPTFNWTVSQGTIASGQGTSSITVQLDAAATGNVTATAEVGGLCTTCPTTYSETAGIASPSGPNQFADFGDIPNDQIKANLDPFFSELNNNPDAQGFIINYGTDAQIAQREKNIRAAIKFRKFPANRVTFLRGADQGSGTRTVLYVVAAGQTPPTP